MKRYKQSVKLLLLISVSGAALLGWLVFLSVSQANQAWIWLVGIITIMSLSVAGVRLWQLSRRVDRSIMELIARLKQHSQNNYAQPLLVSGDTNLASLERAIEQMRKALLKPASDTDYLMTVLDGLNDAVLVSDAQNVITRVNAAAEFLTGFSAEQLIGKLLGEVIVTEEQAKLSIASLAASGMKEMDLQGVDGQIVPIALTATLLNSSEAEVSGAIIVMRDISDRKRAERRIRYLARFDALTKLPNRTQFQHLLKKAFARAQRTNRMIALLYLDLDHFKQINDTFGNEAGDLALEILSERLINVVSKETIIGRMAGDEFAVCIEGLDLQGDVRAQTAAIAKNMLTEFSKPFHVQQHELFLTVSIGIAFAPQGVDGVTELIRHADAAMHYAKQKLGNTFGFYTAEMNAAMAERLMLKTKLRRAVEQDELVMLYQPKVDLRTHKVIGAEALLRWRLPGYGDIAPSQFIPLAEETSLIIGIGDWVINRVCEDYKRWSAQVADPGKVSINLSLKQLYRASFVTRCRNTFKRHGVSPQCFELEITETTLMQNPARTVKLLDKLFAMGVSLSIDDFGTGYSSLSALQQFPISTLKIDQSFVRNIKNEQDDATIVRTIIEMGNAMGLKVLAEGVETTVQMEYLKSHHCHYAQGHLFGKAMSAEAFIAMVSAQQSGQQQITDMPV